MRQVQDKREFVGIRRHFIRWLKQQETGVIFRMIFEMLLQYRGAINCRGAPACDCSLGRIAGFHHVVDASGRIVRSYALYRRVAREESFALRQRHRM